jgi:sortase A
MPLKHLKLKNALLTAMLCALCCAPAHALEYNFDAPENYLFGQATSDDTIYEKENPNVDRSKNTALIPPAFGSPTSYLPGSGEYLTPNLVPGALSGGGLTTSTENVIYPTVDVSTSWVNNAISYTEVTSNLYYSGGYLATLKIPTLGVNVKVYEGTDSTQLAKGAGHFTDTSIWNGNVSMAAHNRGVNNHFGDIHTLNVGDTITLTTKLGTRTYSVTNVSKISEADQSGLAASSENKITLYTCVRDQSAYRWCVTATEQ